MSLLILGLLAILMVSGLWDCLLGVLWVLCGACRAIIDGDWRPR